MEDKAIWCPDDGVLLNGGTSIYTIELPTIQLVGGFVYQISRPTMKQAMMISEHGVLTVTDENHADWLKIPMRRVPLESATFVTKMDNVKPMHYISPHRLREIKNWRATIEFVDFPITGWSATDSPIASKKKWSDFPGELKLHLGVLGRPVDNLLSGNEQLNY